MPYHNIIMVARFYKYIMNNIRIKTLFKGFENRTNEKQMRMEKIIFGGSMNARYLPYPKKF